MCEREKFSVVPRKIECLVGLGRPLVRGQQPTQDADICLEYLRFCVHIEGDPVNDLADSVVKCRCIVEDDEGINRVD